MQSEVSALSGHRTQVLVAAVRPVKLAIRCGCEILGSVNSHNADTADTEILESSGSTEQLLRAIVSPFIATVLNADSASDGRRLTLSEPNCVSCWPKPNDWFNEIRLDIPSALAVNQSLSTFA